MTTDNLIESLKFTLHDLQFASKISEYNWICIFIYFVLCMKL